MKTCRMMFYSDYVSDSQLSLAIQNSSLLDKCYVGFYEKTWEGNPHEKCNINHLIEMVKNCRNVEVVPITNQQIDFKTDRFEVETWCRNFILKKAKKDGYRICIIQDSDEFLIEEEYRTIIHDFIPEIIRLGFDCAAIRWIHFWKSWNWVLTNQNDELAYEWENFIVDLSSEVQFSLGRTLYGNKAWIDHHWFLYHGCYVLNDEEVLQKINTCNRFEFLEMNLEDWYREKWLNWKPEMENLYPSKNPTMWKKAVKYEGPLPKECC